MKSRIITSVAAAGVLALVVSCSQDQTRSISAPTDASYARVPAPPSCSFTTANQDAKAYFSAVKDPVYGLLDAMSTAYKTSAAAATGPGFSVLAQLAAATNAGQVKATATPALGSKFANDVLLCMSVVGYVNTSPVDFSVPLSTGIFAVRSVGDQLAVTSRDLVSPGVPRYGAEPSTSAGWQFTGSPSNKALFYAAPVVSSILDPTVGTVFDLKTLPTPLSFNPSIRVGVCDMTLAEGRIEHVHGSAVILPPSSPNFCTPPSSSLEPASSMFASAAEQVVSWLTPRPAYAASRSMFAAFNGGGGLVTGLSEIGPVRVLEALTLDTIPNASVSDTTRAQDGNPATSQFEPIVTVHVVTTQGTPIAGVQVELTVIGNKGSFVPNGGLATTDALGDAKFPDFTINKAGGYTVSAKVPELGGDVTATSNLFNINGQ